MWWEYDVQGAIEVDSVVGETIAYGVNCIHYLRNYGDEYWIKNDGEVKKLELRTINVGGTENTIEQTWLLQYRLPFILGSYWTETFSDTVVVLGDTYRISQTVSRSVKEINDISVNVGMFIQTYKIEYFETITINDSIEQHQGYEWFAPNVGLVKKIINGITTQLAAYSN